MRRSEKDLDIGRPYRPLTKLEYKTKSVTVVIPDLGGATEMQRQLS
jgi:hypothetical protein